MPPEEQAIQVLKLKIENAYFECSVARGIIHYTRLMGMTRKESLAALEHLRASTAIIQDLDNVLAGNTPPKKGD